MGPHYKATQLCRCFEFYRQRRNRRLAVGLLTFPSRCQPSRINCAAHFASRAAFRFPSPADTIDPFINICHACANLSGSCSFASSARPRTIARIFARWMVAARRTGLSALDSNKTLMKEHPSKDFLWNQPSNTSKIASRRASGLVARRFISDSNQPRVHKVSRRSRNAIASSTFVLKLV